MIRQPIFVQTFNIRFNQALQSRLAIQTLLRVKLYVDMFGEQCDPLPSANSFIQL